MADASLDDQKWDEYRAFAITMMLLCKESLFNVPMLLSMLLFDQRLLRAKQIVIVELHAVNANVYFDEFVARERPLVLESPIACSQPDSPCFAGSQGAFVM